MIAAELALAERVNWDGVLTPLIDRLKSCEFQVKPWWWFIGGKRATTTVDPHKIYLSKNWFSISEYYRTGILLHESIHCFQYDRNEINWIKYFTCKKHRFDVEKPAEYEQIRWYIRTGKVPVKGYLYLKTEKLNPIQAAVNELKNETGIDDPELFNYYYHMAVHDWEIWNDNGRFTL